MGKAKVKTYKINVTGITENQYKFVDARATRKGTNRAIEMKLLIDGAMEAAEIKG